MSRVRVVATGIGLATALGTDLPAFASALLTGSARFDTLRTTHGSVLPVARMPADTGAAASRSEAAVADRSSLLALAAAGRAIADAGLADTPLDTTAVYLGCGSGPSHSVNDAFNALLSTGRLPGLTLLRCLPSAAASSVAIRHGLGGSSQTYSCACASSTQAIGEAARAIRHGYLSRVLAGGAEAPLGDGNLKAWDMLRVLAPPGDDPATACRPFDVGRCGLVLGEGAVVFVLESLDAALARGARIHAELLGYGNSCDARHWTEPSADGQMLAMRATLDDAGLHPHDVMAINAHGTGTLVGDAVEAESVSRLFGSGTAGPPISSTKSAHGHLLGASGAVELAAAIVTLQRGLVPPTRNLREADAGCALNLVAGKPAAVRSGRAVLSNSFAFGGINACLAVGASA